MNHNQIELAPAVRIVPQGWCILRARQRSTAGAFLLERIDVKETTKIVSVVATFNQGVGQYCFDVTFKIGDQEFKQGMSAAVLLDEDKVRQQLLASTGILPLFSGPGWLEMLHESNWTTVPFDRQKASQEMIAGIRNSLG